MEVVQGLHRGVRQDVSWAGLPGSRAWSAVFLIHAEGLRQAPNGSKTENRKGVRR